MFCYLEKTIFFGDTLSHSALLGVTLALSFDINIALSVFFVSSAVALNFVKTTKNYQLAW